MRSKKKIRSFIWWQLLIGVALTKKILSTRGLLGWKAWKLGGWKAVIIYLTLTAS
jgi:hypothetical protein